MKKYLFLPLAVFFLLVIFPGKVFAQQLCENNYGGNCQIEDSFTSLVMCSPSSWVDIGQIDCQSNYGCCVAKCEDKYSSQKAQCLSPDQCKEGGIMGTLQNCTSGTVCCTPKESTTPPENPNTGQQCREQHNGSCVMENIVDPQNTCSYPTTSAGRVDCNSGYICCSTPPSEPTPPPTPPSSSENCSDIGGTCDQYLDPSTASYSCNNNYTALKDLHGCTSVCCVPKCADSYSEGTCAQQSDCEQISALDYECENSGLVCCKKKSSSGSGSGSEGNGSSGNNSTGNGNNSGNSSNGSSSSGSCDKSPEEGMGTGGFLLYKGSIVPCARKCDDPNTSIDESQDCTLCHLIIMMYNIFRLLIALLIIVALVFVTISGTIYILSTGNPGMKGMAKNILTKTLTGFAITLLAWLIVFTTLKFISAKTEVLGNAESGGKWWEFTCDTTSAYGSGGGGSESKKCTDQGSGYYCIKSTSSCNENDELKSSFTCDNIGTDSASCCGPKSTLPSGTLSHEEAKARLEAAGIGITSTGSCSDPNNSKCTSLEGIPASTIDNLINIKNTCGTSVTVTGGTETGHQSHGSGKSIVDLSWDESLAACMKNNADKLNVVALCTAPQDAEYRIECTYDETNQHIHVQFKN